LRAASAATFVLDAARDFVVPWPLPFPPAVPPLPDARFVAVFFAAAGARFAAVVLAARLVAGALAACVDARVVRSGETRRAGAEGDSCVA
jgi:hypothetical protein